MVCKSEFLMKFCYRIQLFQDFFYGVFTDVMYVLMIICVIINVVYHRTSIKLTSTLC